MHAALQIPELLYVILKDLIIFDPGEDDDFLACAVVCSSWYNATVQLNQECPQHLLPLLRILGGIEPEDGPRSQYWGFKQVPTGEAWDKLYEITSKTTRWKIVSLQVYYMNGPRFMSPRQASESAKQILASPKHSAGGPLFPKLKYIGGVSGVRTVWAIPIWAPLLFQARLISATIEFYDFKISQEESTAFMVALISNCPNLRSLSITSNESAFHDPLLVARLPHLEVLRIDTHITSGEVLKSISRLRYLKSISMGSFSGDVVRFDDGYFPSLEELQIIKESNETVDWMHTAKFYPPVLQKIQTNDLSPTGFATLVDYINEAQLAIKSLDSTFQPEFLYKNLEPLTTLVNLEHIHLYFSVLHIGDRQFETLIKHFPQLRSFEFRGTFPKLSFSAIFNIVRYCPKVSHIHIIPGTTKFPPIPRITELLSVESRSLAFDFGESEVRKPAQMARWLNTCCARYPELYVKGGEEGSWKKVQELLNGLNRPIILE